METAANFFFLPDEPLTTNNCAVTCQTHAMHRECEQSNRYYVRVISLLTKRRLSRVAQSFAARRRRILIIPRAREKHGKQVPTFTDASPPFSRYTSRAFPRAPPRLAFLSPRSRGPRSHFVRTINLLFLDSYAISQRGFNSLSLDPHRERLAVVGFYSLVLFFS